MITFKELRESKVNTIQKKTKDLIDPKYHDQYDFKKVKNSLSMLNMLDRAKMHKHLKKSSSEKV